MSKSSVSTSAPKKMFLKKNVWGAVVDGNLKNLVGTYTKRNAICADGTITYVIDDCRDNNVDRTGIGPFVVHPSSRVGAVFVVVRIICFPYFSISRYHTHVFIIAHLPIRIGNGDDAIACDDGCHPIQPAVLYCEEMLLCLYTRVERDGW